MRSSDTRKDDFVNDNSVRFQVSVNGQLRCTAGMSGPGTLDVTVCRHRSKRNINKPEHTHIWAGYLNSLDRTSGSWLLEDLSPGDEITIRTLDPEEHDPPKMSSNLSDENA